jgi:uncharacterized glyoxalase superfamily protein PhnB
MGFCISRQWLDFSRMTQGQRRFTDAETEIFALDPLRLRFRNPETEREFVRDTVRQSMNYIRAYLIAGFGLYGLFGILDAVVGGPDTLYLMLIRYGVVFPIFGGIFLATFFPVFLRHSQFFLGTIMVAAGFGIVAMTLIMSVPFKSQYYAGLIMVVIYCGNLIKLQYLNAALIACALVASYLAISLWINPVPYFNQVANNLFLIMATAIGLYSNYFEETYLRRAYVWQKLIRARNELTVSRVPVDEKGRTMHVHLYINGGSLMMSDPYPEHGHPFQTPQGITIHMKVDDVDASWKRAVDAGCTVTMELADMFWGDRYGQLKDPFGFHWSMGAPIRK